MAVSCVVAEDGPLQRRRPVRHKRRRETLCWRTSRPAAHGRRGGGGNKRGGQLAPPAPRVPIARREAAKTGVLLGRSVLELLQRADLHLDGGRLGGEPLLFLGERVDALAARLG